MNPLAETRRHPSRTKVSCHEWVLNHNGLNTLSVEGIVDLRGHTAEDVVCSHCLLVEEEDVAGMDCSRLRHGDNLVDCGWLSEFNTERPREDFIRRARFGVADLIPFLTKVRTSTKHHLRGAINENATFAFKLVEGCAHGDGILLPQLHFMDHQVRIAQWGAGQL